MGVNANAPSSVINVGQGTVGLRDFVGQGGFARFAFADDEHFGLVEMILPLSSELGVVVEDGGVALANDFYGRFFDGIFVELNAVGSEGIIYFDL